VGLSKPSRKPRLVTQAPGVSWKETMPLMITMLIQAAMK